MVDFVKTFERVMARVLIGLMAVVVVLSVIDLAWVLIKDFTSPPLVVLDIDELLEVFGMFLLVLIGIELLETLMAYVREREVRAELVVLVAMIALARKIITIEVETVPSASLLGIAAMIVALGITFYLIRRMAPPKKTPQASEGA